MGIINGFRSSSRPNELYQYLQKDRKCVLASLPCASYNDLCIYWIWGRLPSYAICRENGERLPTFVQSALPFCWRMQYAGGMRGRILPMETMYSMAMMHEISKFEKPWENFQSQHRTSAVVCLWNGNVNEHGWNRTAARSEYHLPVNTFIQIGMVRVHTNQMAFIFCLDFYLSGIFQMPAGKKLVWFFRPLFCLYNFYLLFSLLHPFIHRLANVNRFSAQNGNCEKNE